MLSRFGVKYTYGITSPGNTSFYISVMALLSFMTNLRYLGTLVLQQYSSAKLSQIRAGQVVPTTCWGVESPIVRPLSRCVSPTMAPDILYEICPGQWLVETKLSHSNRELCALAGPRLSADGEIPIQMV